MDLLFRTRIPKSRAPWFYRGKIGTPIFSLWRWITAWDGDIIVLGWGSVTLRSRAGERERWSSSRHDWFMTLGAFCICQLWYVGCVFRFRDGLRSKKSSDAVPWGTMGNFLASSDLFHILTIDRSVPRLLHERTFNWRAFAIRFRFRIIFFFANGKTVRIRSCCGQQSEISSEVWAAL